LSKIISPNVQLVTLVCALMGYVLASFVAADEIQKRYVVRYPTVVGESLYDNQSSYFIAVLQLALEKSGVAHDIVFVDIPDLAQGRSQSLINQGTYDIHWLATSIEREVALNPIRIPLYRGLLGLRLAFVNGQNPNFFAQIRDLEQLKQRFMGQGRDWIDTKILSAHGFRILAASTTDSLVEMLQIDRIDYFPRSILEIWWEAEQQKTTGLSVDPYIALFYPEAVYFFVRNDDQKLHNIVLSGLNKALQDGSFQQNFDRFFAASITRSKLNQRKIFHLSNPYLPEKTPLADKRLWHPLVLEKQTIPLTSPD
jgi:ABC-type amino acid transport substrate-binding protein